MIKKYVKKIVPVEAIQFDGDNDYDIAVFTDYHIYRDSDNNIFVETLEGDHQFHKGDYIIKGIKGEFYSCRKNIFEESYMEFKEVF